jgi:hypothetical protein
MTQVEFTTQVLARRRPIKYTPERIQQIKNLVERGKSREEIADLVGVTAASLQVTCSRLGVSLRRPIFNTGTGSPRRAAPGPNGTANHHADDASKGVILQSTKERPEQNSQSAPVEQSQKSTKYAPERIQQIKNLVERGKSRSGPNGNANHHADDASKGAILQSTKERPEQNSQSAPVEQSQSPTPHQAREKGMNEVGLANFAIRMRYKGEERAIELPLTDDMIRQLAFEAELRDMRIGELIGELMVAMLRKDLFQAVLPREQRNNSTETT